VYTDDFFYVCGRKSGCGNHFLGQSIGIDERNTFHFYFTFKPVRETVLIGFKF